MTLRDTIINVLQEIASDKRMQNRADYWARICGDAATLLKEDELAIERAMEFQPLGHINTPKMDDLISRAAVIEAIRETWQLVNRFAKPYDLIRVVECIKAIKQLPAVDAIPVEWLREKIKEHTDKEGWQDYLANSFGLCIEEWQKEQEAR